MGPHFFGGGYASTWDLYHGGDAAVTGGKGGKDTAPTGPTDDGKGHVPIYFKGGKDPGYRFVIGDLGPRVTPFDVCVLDFLFAFMSVHGFFALHGNALEWHANRHTIGTRIGTR